MSDPRIVPVNVGCIGMARPVGKIRPWSGRLWTAVGLLDPVPLIPVRLLNSGGNRTVARNMPVAGLTTTTATLVVAPALRMTEEGPHASERNSENESWYQFFNTHFIFSLVLNTPCET